MPDEASYFQPRKVVVIGSGVSGLACAHRLTELAAAAQREIEITILEKGARCGGVIKTERRDGFLLEGGADSFISDKPAAIRLAERLGIADQLVPTNDRYRRSFLVRKGKLRPVPEGFHLLAPAQLIPFFASGVISWRGKARMAAELFMPRRANEKIAINSAGADESLADFVRRRFGREALDRVAQPMVGGIYTADPEKLSLRATMPGFLEMETRHGSVTRALLKQKRKTPPAQTKGTSGARYSMFLSFAEGMQTLIDALVATFPPDRIKLNTEVRSLEFVPASSRWRINLLDGETLDADAVCLALPAYAAAKLLATSAHALAEDLQAIEYASTATLNLAYKLSDAQHAMNGFGFVVPVVENLTVLACTFCHVKFAGRAPEGYALLRAFVGGALQPENFALDETEILRRVRADFSRLLGINAAPVFHGLNKWSRSMAQYHVGHHALIKRIKDGLNELPGLQLAGNAYDGAGVPDCVRGGETAAETLWADLQSTSG